MNNDSGRGFLIPPSLRAYTVETNVLTVRIKVFYHVAALLGKARPCPLSISWTLEMPVRVRTLSRVLDEIGIQVGSRCRNLGWARSAHSGNRPARRSQWAAAC